MFTLFSAQKISFWSKVSTHFERIEGPWPSFKESPYDVTITRVANVVADHDDLLTQWRPIKMSKFRANIFLIQTTSNYFWASEVFKTQKFRSHLFSFFKYKKYPKLKTWIIFMQLSFFINKNKNLRQFSEKYFSRIGP